MVEGLHDVVGDEGGGLAQLGELVVARDPQRKVKLEAGAFRKLLGRLRAAVGAERDQRLALPIRQRGQAAIGSAADLGEGL